MNLGVLDGVPMLLERKHAHDTAWLVTQAGIVLGLVLAARLGFVVDFESLVVLFVAYAFLYALASEACHRIRTRASLAVALRVLHLSTVVFLACVWWYLGGAKTPLFLLAFAVPVMSASILTLRGQSYLAATVATLCVWGVAAFQSLAIEGTGAVSRSFVPATSGGFATQTASFAVSQFVLAAVAGVNQQVVEAMRRRLTNASRALEVARNLHNVALQVSPFPEALVKPHTGLVVQSSNALTTRAGGETVGQSLFDLVTFEHEDEIRAALRSREPSETLTVFTLGSEKRVGHVATVPIEAQGQSIVHVSLRDERRIYLQCAVEELDAALLVADPDTQLAYFNRRARKLFQNLQVGQPFGDVLNALRLPRRLLAQVGEGRWQIEGELDATAYSVTLSVFHASGLGRLAILAARPSNAGGTAEVLNPIRVFYSPRMFTEVCSRFLQDPHSTGSFGIVRLVRRCASREPDSPTTDEDELNLLRDIERQLGESDVFLGLRAGEFALLAPGRPASEVARLLEQAEALRQGDTNRELTIDSSIVTISPGEDLDALMSRASRGLRRIAGKAS